MKWNVGFLSNHHHMSSVLLLVIFWAALSAAVCPATLDGSSSMLSCFCQPRLSSSLCRELSCLWYFRHYDCGFHPHFPHGLFFFFIRPCVSVSSSLLCLSGALLLSHVCLGIHLLHHPDHLDSDIHLAKQLPMSSFLLPQSLPVGSTFTVSADSSCFALAQGSSFAPEPPFPCLWHQALFYYLHITLNKSLDCDGSPLKTMNFRI